MELVLLLTSVITFISFIAYYLIQRSKFNLPPGPRPWPIIGNLYGLKVGLFKSYNDWAREYGPIISVWLGSNLNVVVSDSELAKLVLKEHDQVLANRFKMRANANISANGQDLIWADYGPHFVKVRKMCNLELFSAKKIDELRPIREDEVASMVDSIYNDCTKIWDEKLGSTLVVRKYLGEVALNTITRLVLGKRFINSKGELDEQGQEFKAIVMDGRKLMRSSFMYEYIPLLRWFLPSNDHKFKKHQARIDRLTVQIMEEHTKARTESGATKQHFVDALLSLMDHYELTKDSVIGILWNMIIAGMDTTAIIVEWAIAELIRNPQVLRKAHEELDQVIGLDRIMTEDDIVALPYLQAIVKEALRLHPPAPLMLPHKAKTHVKIGGYDIPKDTTIHVNCWAIGRDPNNWCNPIHFTPERFFELDVDFRGSDFRLLPFGAGRRVCIGSQLGLNLVTLMLGRLLHHFNWCPPKGVEPMDINMLENDSVFVTYMATPLSAQPVPRLPSHLYKWLPLDEL